MVLGAVGFMFSPEAMEAQFSVVASRVDGMGTLRGDLGGLFLTLAVFYSLWFASGQKCLVGCASGIYARGAVWAHDSYPS